MPPNEVRAGEYARFEGHVYHAFFHFFGETTLLTTLEAQGEPPGPGWTRELDGHWTRSVRRVDLERLYTVGTMALWKNRYAVHITAISGTIADFDWNSEEVAVGRAFGFDGRGPSPEREAIHKRPEGGMGGRAPLEEFSDIRQREYDYPLIPPLVATVPEAPKKPKRGKAPRLGH